MYQTPHFREDRVDVLHEFIRAHPFAAFVAHGQGGLIANHMPFALHDDVAAHGVLRGHVARANPLWKSFDSQVEAVAIFQGPENYVTPSWYPSKKEHGKVVPTWNYAVVHVHGALSVVEDAAWLRAHLETLTFQQENARPVPWEVGDAPDDYIVRQLKGIVGIELSITRLEGKWKVSQNKNELDRQGVSRGFAVEAGGTASEMSALVALHGQDN